MVVEFRSAAALMLRGATTGHPRAPGVVAMASDREGNFYEGAAGVRRLGGEAEMTTDAVFALFSCTKAITGTAVLRLVEEGRLDLDAPAKNYVPEIGALRVFEGYERIRRAQAAAAQARNHDAHVDAAHRRLRL